MENGYGEADAALHKFENLADKQVIEVSNGEFEALKEIYPDAYIVSYSVLEVCAHALIWGTWTYLTYDLLFNNYVGGKSLEYNGEQCIEEEA